MASANGCLDLRNHAFAPGRQVSTEWSRCPGSMARRARGSGAPLRRSSAGWMTPRIERLSAGVGRIHNSQDIVDGGADEPGMTTAAPNRKVVLYG